MKVQNNMKKIYLHIGPHKTGSTYIQKVLFESRKLLSKKGLYYSEYLIGPQWGHHQLVEAIKQRNIEKIQEFLLDLSDTSFVSSENFENLSGDDIQFFFSLLEDFSVEIIFVKRSFSELIISNWQESIKHGSYKIWPEFVLEHVMKPFSSLILNQSSTLEKWSQLSNKTHAINYDKLKEDKIDIVDYILRITLGDEFEKVSTGHHINASMNYSDIEIIRILNMISNNEGIPPSTRVRDSYLKLKKEKNSTIEYLLSKINEELVEFKPSDSWGIKSFEMKFDKELFSTQRKKEGKTYLLPNPNSNLMLVHKESILELHNRIKEEANEH